MEGGNMATGANFSKLRKKIALNLLGHPQRRNYFYRASASLLGIYVFSFQQIPYTYQLYQSLTNTNHTR
jgi:hypothetical protein